MNARLVPILLLTLIIGLVPGATAAQSVVGTLTTASGEPVAGAVMSLVDQGGETRGQTLTSPTGRFHLPVPEPGEYRVRVERIGFATHTGPPVIVAAGETVLYPMRARVEALTLEGITAEGEPRCLRDPVEGRQAIRLWEEARKALTAASLTEREGLLRYRLSLQERELTEDGRVLAADTRRREVFNRVPLASAGPDTLAAAGYVWFEEDGAFVFHAPDAELLLSDAFLDDHCFRPRVGRGERVDQVGLSFEPVPERRIPEISGTFWLDRETAELREIEFHWVNLPWLGVQGEARGAVRLERAPTGAWFVRSAMLRMPRTLQRLRDGEYRVVAFREKAFEVGDVTQMGGAVVLEAPVGSIRGTVTEVEEGDAIPGVEVYVVGTEHRTSADSLGRFLFTDVPQGIYAVAASPPEGGALFSRLEAVAVDVGGGEVAQVALHVRVQPRTAKHRVRVVTVLEEWDTGDPLVGASATLDGGEARVSDESGRVRWERVAPGTHEIEVTHLAVGTQRDSLEVEGEGTEVFRVRVLPQAVELEGLEVTVEREEPGGGWMAAFHRRMETHSGGHFVTREQFERREAQPLMTTLQALVPGLRRVCSSQPGQGSATFCTLESSRRAPSFMGGRCQLVYYLDGMRFDLLPGMNVDDILRTWDVEAAEFYPGPSSTPVQFNSPDARCGVLVLWTRQPGPRVQPGNGGRGDGRLRSEMIIRPKV